MYCQPVISMLLSSREATRTCIPCWWFPSRLLALGAANGPLLPTWWPGGWAHSVTSSWGSVCIIWRRMYVYIDYIYIYIDRYKIHMHIYIYIPLCIWNNKRLSPWHFENTSNFVKGCGPSKTKSETAWNGSETVPFEGSTVRLGFKADRFCFIT